ncbi:hypothetical protein K458DRAFT_406603 [Lentithecium fluviatile CBS 122367]|uniref:Heterokaryon incompatibility domain-containing protein n=1 Tax=Lentithecium fluviatile CBS 122367 TaxID=1168545 RepID=A0A6G1ISL6_9PLEO|nr:hypothetical protein K458DRAFT_406603 [Lentithecium fluviatile CBS 122367]
MEEMPHYLCFRGRLSGHEKQKDRKIPELQKANVEIHRRLSQHRKDGFCARCSRLDFKEFGDPNWDQFEPSYNFDKEISPLVGKAEEKWRINTEDVPPCSFCSKISSKAMSSWSVHRPASFTADLGFISSQYAAKGLQPVDRADGSIIRKLAIYPRVRLPSFRPTFSKDDASQGVSQEAYNRTPRPHVCIARKYLHRTVEYAQVLRWIEACDKHHGHEAIEKTNVVERLPFVQLIDVKRRCLGLGNLGFRYAAMSYTWGSVKQYCLTKGDFHSLQKSGSLSDNGGKLSGVVKGTMIACESLLIPYL